MDTLPEFKTLTHEQLTTEVAKGARTWLTKALFWQFRATSEYAPIFTLNEYDHDGCYSLYKLVMQYADEYSAALAIFGSWQYWNHLKARKWMKPHIDAWVDEMEIRDKAQAKATLLANAKDGNTQAATSLLNSYKKRPGRPTKADAERQAKIAAGVDSKVTDIVTRMQNK